jgi:hypothetical protein
MILLSEFVLLVQIITVNGVEIKPASTYSEYGQCVYTANQLKLAIINNEFDEEIVAAGCADCNEFPEYCGEGI